MERSSSRSGFQSRRSYPSFNHLSLTPLNPRYPIDDDDLESESQGYYSARSASPETERPPSANDYTSTPRPSSYLSSMSVPGTPGVLSQSQSRSTSRTRTRHGRSKSSSRMHLDGTRMRRRSSSSRTRRSVDSDSEWMHRTGIMLASSTLEEKGQSWLVKRASSTSLASEAANNNYNSYIEEPAAAATASSSSRPRSSTNSKAASQKLGMSTPSRPGSQSSRRGSKPDLATSGLEMTSSYTWVPTSASEKSEFTPDAVDERIRAEMVNMQHNADVDMNVDDGASSSSPYASGASSDSEDEIDEKEMQRLTRESGFGLGSWLDRMVEWTFFGVDEWPALFSAGPDNRDNHDPTAPHGERVVEDRQVTPEGAVDKHLEDYSDIATIFSRDDENFTPMVDKPGDGGGWEDAKWFFKTIKQALVL